MAYPATEDCAPYSFRMHYSEYHVRLAAYALIVNDAGEILLTWFNGGERGHPAWTLPGGGVEFEESLAQALVREVYEETGYEVVAGPIVGDSFLLRPATAGALPVRSQRLIFAATIVGGTLGTTEVGGTTDFARWIPLTAVPDLDDRAEIIDIAIAAIIRAASDGG